MDKILTLLSHVGEIRFRSDDDSVDRLSRRYTTLFLVLFALLVSTKQYVGEPIACWVPAQFTPNHETYANKVCWVSNTYYLPFRQHKIPSKNEPRSSIGYYQWIPMILISQATLFYVPCLLWRLIHKRSGLNLKTILDSAASCHQASLSELRERTVRYMVNHIGAFLRTKRADKDGCWSRIKTTLAKKCFFVAGTVYGNYLTCAYLFIKLLYIGNCIGQLFLLNMFIGTDYHMFGVKVVLALIRGEDWRSSIRFPRVTLCDFEIRELGNVHRHTVQCVLPINLFNEKIYVFIWFWFVFVAIVTVLSFFQWLIKYVNSNGQEQFVRRELLALDKINRETMCRTSVFTKDFLRQDGVFLMRLVAKNSGEMIAAEVMGGLWDAYIRENRLLMDNSAPAHSPSAPPML